VHQLLAIFIDALGFETIKPDVMPFIHGLSKELCLLPLKPILGYSDAIRATLFTGTYPDRHGYWIMYKFDPENSPYRVYKPLKFLDKLPGALQRGAKTIISGVLSNLMRRVGSYSDVSTHNIPYNVLHFFSRTCRRELYEPRALPIPTIFDILREEGMKFAYIRSQDVNVFKAVKKLKDEDFVLIYLHYLDFAGHRYGLTGPDYRYFQRAVDLMVRTLIKELGRKAEHMLIFSDHGMTEPKHYVDLSWLIRSPEHGLSYLLFLDSTIVHIWYLEPGIKDNLRNVFQRMPYGHILSDEEKKELRILFKHRWYGDDVYLLEPDYQIFPNYISLLRPKAMHAYHPGFRHQWGILIGEFDGKPSNEPVTMPDITATMADILGLRKPAYCEGSSLLLWCLFMPPLYDRPLGNV